MTTGRKLHQVDLAFYKNRPVATETVFLHQGKSFLEADMGEHRLLNSGLFGFRFQVGQLEVIEPPEIALAGVFRRLRIAPGELDGQPLDPGPEIQPIDLLKLGKLYPG